MKNRYYNINNEYLIVEFKDNKYAVFSNDAKTIELLRDYVWHINSDGYSCNSVVKRFHQNYLNYGEGLVCDHINRLRYDNRQNNLRIITHRQNTRNKTKRQSNTSGKNGVCFKTSTQSWVATIRNNNNHQLYKSFSINHNGNAEAKQMAINQRLQWEHEFNYEGE